MSERVEILWALAGFADRMQCELAESPLGYALGLRMGDELIQTELLPSRDDAEAKAQELRSRLLMRGWIEVSS